MPRKKELQFVWPKDGVKGKSGRRGFFGGMSDIMKGKGPDIFLQKKSSSKGIKPDVWGNWDSYHNFACHLAEQSYENGLWGTSREYKRYDPHARKYVNWVIPEDWAGNFMVYDPSLPWNPPTANYPHYTQEEARKINRSLFWYGRVPDPRSMGSDWNHMGPERFNSSYDHFWQDAHRIGENQRQQLPLGEDANRFMRMHQQTPQDYPWVI